MTGWNQKMAKMAFKRSRFRRLAWGDGDPYPYTPRANWHYQWEDWPLWEKLFHMAMYAYAFNFWIWCMVQKFNTRADWASEEALRRARLRREAQELMVLEGEVFDSDVMPERR